MSNIQPYNISVPASEIDTLNQKLSLARFPESSDEDWERGTPAADLRRISQYWREEFSWKSYEDRLNQLPHYEATVSVDGFDPFRMHFIHQRSEAQDAIPLLFVHGCAYACSIEKPSGIYTDIRGVLQGQVVSSRHSRSSPFLLKVRRMAGLPSM